MPVRPPSVLSSFSGVGGLDLGLETAGFRSVGCIEIDPVARRSLEANRAERWPLLEPGDVAVVAESLSPRQLDLTPGELTLLAGGPPCQPYSKAAMWAAGAWSGLADQRAQPLFSFLALVDRFLPACVLIENVPGFVRGPHAALRAVADRLDEINQRHGTRYTPEARVLDAAHFGVPQRRQRAILVALRDGGDFAWPDATHADDQRVRAWDALWDLDDPTAAPQATGQWADLLPSIPEGHNYLWHTDRGGGEWLFGYRTRYWSFLLKLAKTLSSWTVPADPGPAIGPFHWESRPLRTSELLRLQSFPATWAVEGNRREQVRQVGNATPPLLAEVLGRAVRTTLEGLTWSAPPTLRIERVDDVPPPEPVAPVPNRYVVAAARPAAHPGAGLGPSPRAPRSPAPPTGDAGALVSREQVTDRQMRK